MLRLEYTYLANDLPETIVEAGPGGDPATGWIATSTFSYDKRRRLIGEVRNAFDTATGYNRSYVYDKGGNRTRKIDVNNGGEVDYTYDVSNPSLYSSNNNRLMQAVTLDAYGAALSTSWYYYTAAGNVERVVTREEPTGGAVAAASSVEAQGGTVETTVEGSAEATALAAGGGTGCTDPLKQYTATRFGYAKNGNTVTYVEGESWCSIEDPATCPASYIVNWAREFRYDGARARYMNRQLNPSTLATVSTVWSDYDGDEIYGDFEMVSGSPVNKRSFEPGIGRTESPLTIPVTNYYHGDEIGTTRLMSNPNGDAIESAVCTAFGEPIIAPGVSDQTRYGFAGAWGYQQNVDFAFMHVGARYYDPSSGRFLQRDPIGVFGSPNVYAYALNNPLVYVDPSGLTVITLPIVGGGTLAGGLTAGAAATAGAAGAVVVGGAVAIDLTIDLVIAMSHYSKVKRLLEQADKIDEWIGKQFDRLRNERNPEVRERIIRELKKGRDAARKLRDLAREIAEGC